MPDLAPARSLDAAALADTVGREVVVEHQLLAELVLQAIDALLVAGGAQRRGDDGLRLAALEESRAVHARPDADLAVERADLLVGAAVDAFALEDGVANDMLLQQREGRLDLIERVWRGLVAFRLGGSHFLEDTVLQLLDGGGALGLALRLFALLELVVVALADLVPDGVLAPLGNDLGRLAHLRAQLLDHLDDGADMLVAEQDRLHHLLLGHLAREALDHGDRRARAGDDEVEVALLELRVCWHQHELAVDAADADAAGWLHERNLRDVQGGAAADHAQHVGVVLAVSGAH